MLECSRTSALMAQPFQPQRNGTSVTCFHLDGQNPGQQQLLTVALAGVGVALLALPAIQAHIQVALA